MEGIDKTTAEKIREACAKEFIRAYEEVGIKGLCEDGRIEYAADAVRSLYLEKILKNITHK
ncbi:MAG: hypothetical protein WB779_15270 [Ignavibacteriaceae bacterium]